MGKDAGKALRDGPAPTGVLVFLSLFAAQAGLIAVSPVLADVARDLDVSTAEAGQLRTVAGLVAALAALAVTRAGGRIGLRSQLVGAGGLLALGSLASAAAPTFAVLALAQVPVGVGVGVLTTSGTLAAAAWVTPERRIGTLSWALVGQPAAWIVGMPLVGLVGAASWRYGWLALPFAAAVTASLALARGAPAQEASAADARVGLRSALGDRGVSRWFAAEVLANTAWAGILVYAGAFFVESYGASSTLTGVVLAVGAGAYVLGNMTTRRLIADEPKGLLLGIVPALAVSTALFGVLRPSLVVSTALFSTAAFAAGGRTLASSAFGLAASPELRPVLMGVRAASMQVGHFAGSLLAGTALAAGGYTALGFFSGLLFVAAAVVLAGAAPARTALRAVLASRSGRWSFGFSGHWRSSTASRRCGSPLGSSGPCWQSSC